MTGSDFFLAYCIQSNILLAAREAGTLTGVGSDQGLGNVSIQGQVVNIGDFAGHMFSVAGTQILGV